MEEKKHIQSLKKKQQQGSSSYYFQYENGKLKKQSKTPINDIQLKDHKEKIDKNDQHDELKKEGIPGDWFVIDEKLKKQTPLNEFDMNDWEFI